MGEDLTRGPLGRGTVHLCVDMQRLFAENTDWHTPWMDKVRPMVERLVVARPDRTIFTRFVPVARAGEGTGTWRRYYETWASMTRERLGEGMVDLVPELDRHAPPAAIIDKKVYSPWFQPELDAVLAEWEADTIVVSGGETDVCVLATVLGAVDRGFRVVVATDALCSSSDLAHDASVTLYLERYGQQVEAATVDSIIAAWT